MRWIADNQRAAADRRAAGVSFILVKNRCAVENFDGTGTGNKRRKDKVAARIGMVEYDDARASTEADC